MIGAGVRAVADALPLVAFRAAAGGISPRTQSGTSHRSTAPSANQAFAGLYDKRHRVQSALGVSRASGGGRSTCSDWARTISCSCRGRRRSSALPSSSGSRAGACPGARPRRCDVSGPAQRRVRPDGRCPQVAGQGPAPDRLVESCGLRQPGNRGVRRASTGSRHGDSNRRRCRSIRRAARVSRAISSSGGSEPTRRLSTFERWCRLFGDSHPFTASP